MGNATPAVTDWYASALCAQVDMDLWFPVRGSPVTVQKTVCRRCPVRPQCLEEALANLEQWGIWAGFTTGERRVLGRQWHAGRSVEHMIAEDDARYYARIEARRAA